MIELLCLDVDGTLTDGRLVYGYSWVGNSSLDKHSADLGFFGVSQTQSLVSTPKNPKNYESHTENPSVVLNAKCAESSLRGARSEASATKQSKKNRHTERSEVSKTRESKSQSESRAENKINKLDSLVQHCDSYNLDSRDLDSSLRASHFAQNDEYSTDSHESQSLQITEIAKVFNVKDGLAIAYWRKVLNRKVAIITGKGSEILRIRANELQIPSDLLFMNVRDKGKIVRELKQRFALDSAQIAAVGDDLNDISMFAESALNFAPNDCATALKSLKNLTILNAKGGESAVREAIELILQKEKLYEKFIQYWQ